MLAALVLRAFQIVFAGHFVVLRSIVVIDFVITEEYGIAASRPTCGVTRSATL
jgi:hypothetical protein